MLSSVIVVSQLVRLSEVLVTFGLSFENVLLPFLFILLPFLGIIIPIALMFSILLAYSRMSADGEYTALLASGYSLKRSIGPVLVVSFCAYIVAALGSVYFEAWGRRETLQFYHRKTQNELDNMIRYRLKPGVFMDDFLGYVLYAEKISSDRTHFENVMLGPGKNSPAQHFTLLAPSASLEGAVSDGELRMTFDYGLLYSAQSTSREMSVVKFKKLQLDLLHIFRDQIFGPENAEDDYRSYSPTELWNYITTLAEDTPQKERDNYLKARYLFHQRFSMPFACFVFSLFAMVFGIQDERRGKSYGFLGSCLAIIVGYILIMAFKFLAEKGYLSAPLAAWLPQAMLLTCGIFLAYQKNRLPPSESILDLKNLPLLRRFKRHND